MGVQGGIRRWLASLRARMLLTFWLVALVPLVTLAILDERATRASLTAASYRSLDAAASQTSSRIDQFFKTNLEVVETQAAQPMLAEYLVALASAKDDPQSRKRVVETLASFAVKDRIFISSSALLDLRGRDVVDTAAASVGGDESDRTYFRAALETNLPHASPVLFLGDNGSPSLYFSSPVRDARGRTVGVLRTEYSAAVLQQIVIQDAELVGAWSFPMLVDDDWILLAYGAASHIRVADLLFKPTRPLADDEIRLEGQLAFQERGPWAAAVRRLEQMPWSVLFVQPEHVFLAPVEEHTRKTVLVVLAYSALVALIAHGVARVLARPVEQLTRVSRRIAAGEFETPVHVGAGGELGILADSIEHMASAVQQRERALRERAEALRESHLRLEAFIDNATALISLKDLAGRFLLVNRRFEELFHVDREALIGKTVHDVFPAEIADAIQAHDAETLRAGEPRQWEEIRPHDDGPHTYLSVKFALPDAGGAVYALGTFSTDITERKQAELERTRLVEQLREAVRARDEFLAIASHELKTPLTPLKLHVQSLQRKLAHADGSGQRPGRVAQSLASLDRQVVRLTALINNMLDMSRMTRGQLSLSLEDVNLSEVVSEVVLRFRSEIAAAGCPIELCLGADLVGRWDRTRVEQVFTNLLTNALKYAGGKPIKVVTERHAGAARLIVQDWGMGIAPEHRDRIFQPFERAVSSWNISGFGLGLYIVRQIVEAHRGCIHLESQVGRGARFIVDLPLRPGATDSRGDDVEAASPCHPSPKTAEI